MRRRTGNDRGYSLWVAHSGGGRGMAVESPQPCRILGVDCEASPGASSDVSRNSHTTDRSNSLAGVDVERRAARVDWGAADFLGMAAQLRTERASGKRSNERDANSGKADVR